MPFFGVCEIVEKHNLIYNLIYNMNIKDRTCNIINILFAQNHTTILSELQENSPRRHSDSMSDFTIK